METPVNTLAYRALRRARNASNGATSTLDEMAKQKPLQLAAYVATWNGSVYEGLRIARQQLEFAISLLNQED